MSEVTLLHYWEELTDKQRRLIWDLVRCNSSKRVGLPMGLLPFIPVKEVKLILLRDPPSPWTSFLFEEYYDHRPTWAQQELNDRYERSKANDRKDYADILLVICKQPKGKTQLAVLLETWKERNLKDHDV